MVTVRTSLIFLATPVLKDHTLARLCYHGATVGYAENCRDRAALATSNKGEADARD